MGTRRQFCTFNLGDLFLGIEVQRVQEVLRYQEVTHVPLAPAVVEGLINLRGQIVTAVDLRRRLDLPERPKDQLPMNLVLRTDDGTVSLLIDAIGDVLDVDEESFEPPPDTVRTETRQLIRGAYKLENRLLLHLDADRALSVTEQS